MKSLTSIPKAKLKGARVLLRLDLNVPIKNDKVSDFYRIERALPTLHYLAGTGARTIILSHIGRKGESLKPVAHELARAMDVGFFPAPFSRVGDLLKELPEGGTVLLENLRRDDGEEKGSRTFAKQLASFGDMYVNDAFAVSHRKHASVYALPKLLPHYAGPLLLEEVEELSRVFKPKRPFILVLGGAKFETKVPVLKRFIKTADRIYLVGAIAHSLYRASGYELGRSLVDTKISARAYLPELSRGKIIVPRDVLVSNGSAVEVKQVDELAPNDTIVDSGPAGIEELRKGLRGARTILWNGPAGNFEGGYGEGTLAIARAIAKSGAYSIVGGGDTIAAIQKLGTKNKISFISTGGGAMLEFLAQGTLPGIDALA